jgi:ABC-type nickel/cobalt efflux system permease component RcnA
MSVVFSQFSRNSAGTGRRIHWRFEEITNNTSELGWTVFFLPSLINVSTQKHIRPVTADEGDARAATHHTHTHTDTHGGTHAAESKTRSRQVQVGRTD